MKCHTIKSQGTLRIFHFLILSFVIASLGCDQLKPKKKEVEIKSDKQKVSYALGQNYGRLLKAQGFEVDPEVLVAAISDAIEGRESRLDQNELRQVMQDARKKALEKRLQDQKKSSNTPAAMENKKKGEAYLAENKKKKSVTTTKTGLQYEVLTKGKGPSPKDTDRVRVHYRGSLIDGTEFDSSYKRNRPAEFAVKGVIPGWTEALALMKPGGKWRLYIPNDLAYGSRQQSRIPAYSVLVFDVELIEILK